MLAQAGTHSIVQLGDQSILLYEKPRLLIRELDISGNPIGIEGVSQFVTGFTSQGTSNLLTLDISRTNMFYHTSEEFVEKFSQLITGSAH